MLYINTNSVEVSKARIEHVKFFTCRISKKITGQNCSGSCSICNTTKRPRWKSKSNIKSAIVAFFTSTQIATILEGLPDKLYQINNDLIAAIDAILPNTQKGKIQKYMAADDKQKKTKQFTMVRLLFSDLHKIFDYDWFIGLDPKDIYSAYHLATSLDRRSCTYCNRTYTTTMKTDNGDKVMRPHFDHWFPKSKYPLLAVSFYNLIPSCYTCNSSIKKDTELTLLDHIHPYVDASQTDDFEFDYFFDGTINKHRIILVEKNTSRTKITLEELKIDIVYNSHLQELEDLIQIKKSYSETYVDEIKKLFNNKLPDNQVYRLLFGTEFDVKDFHRQPLSKFKKDILKKLEIIS